MLLDFINQKPTNIINKIVEIRKSTPLTYWQISGGSKERKLLFKFKKTRHFRLP